MGWLVKIGLFLLMLASIVFSAWIIAVPIGVYFAASYLWGARHRSRGTAASGAKGRRFASGVRMTKLAAVAMFLLAAVAFAVGGRFSTLLFAGVGVALLSYGSVGSVLGFSGVVPVEGSVLLRRRAAPFEWIALAEVKPSRGTLASLLASVKEDLIIQTGENSSVFVAFGERALSRRAAEKSVTSRMRRVARTLAPLGAYLLPVDSTQACKSFRLGLEDEDVEEKDWPVSLRAAAFNVIALRTRGGFVEAFGAYTAEKDQEASPTIPAANRRLRIEPLLMEALAEIERKTNFQSDPATSFLASLHSARAELQGQALELGQNGGDAKTVVVRALSSPSIELSRVQLRALARVYTDENLTTVR